MITERGDFLVVHEPFSQLTDFGETIVGDRRVRNVRELKDTLRELAGSTPVFFKDTMDFRYPELLADTVFLAEVTHSFIVREPAAAIASHFALNPALQRDEVGFARVAELFDLVAGIQGSTPVVIDADDLVAMPEDIVRAYCARVGIPFLAESLNWSPEMRDEWQRTSRWHAGTSETHGFKPPKSAGPDRVDVPGHAVLAGYLAYHLPFYRRLYEARLRPSRAAV
jgi:hypothetical protein